MTLRRRMAPACWWTGWPRGLRKDAARLDEWSKNVAPLTELRTWDNHDPAGVLRSRSAVTGARIRASAPRISHRCSEQITLW